jgi:hypothetical protein
MRVAPTVPNLLVLPALSRARAEAVKLVDLEIIFFRKSTLSLADADVLRLWVVLDILHRQLASVLRKPQKVTQKNKANYSLLPSLVMNELIDLQNVRFWRHQVWHLVDPNRVHERLRQHANLERPRSRVAVRVQADATKVLRLDRLLRVERIAATDFRVNWQKVLAAVEGLVIPAAVRDGVVTGASNETRVVGVVAENALVVDVLDLAGALRWCWGDCSMVQWF